MTSAEKETARNLSIVRRMISRDLGIPMRKVRPDAFLGELGRVRGQLASLARSLQDEVPDLALVPDFAIFPRVEDLARAYSEQRAVS
ncbi:MAG: hypothetical protein WCT32_03410 [Patescibacteria group bacterium]|jgi:hypothetical protein